MSSLHSSVNHAIVRILSVNVPTLTFHTQRNDNLPTQKQRTQGWLLPWRLGLVLTCALLLMVGCGPEKGATEEELIAQVVTIAQTYRSNGDLGTARGELEQLEVANPTQFLIFLAEDRTKSDAGAPDTEALVHLALALGLQSGQLMNYAMAHGLLANAVAPTPETVGVPAVQSLEGVTSNDPVPAADVAVNASGSAPVAEVATATIPAAQPVAAADDATPIPAEGGDTTEEAPAAANPLPTATAAAPTPTTVSKPQVQASNGLNVRGGPGTAYNVVGALNGGEQAEIIAKNPEGDWWQIALPTGGTGWVYGPLVQTSGDTGSIAVATDIPAAPPTPTPAPVAEAPPAAPEQPAEEPPAEEPPAEDPPAEDPPAEEPPAEAPPADLPGGNDFVGIERRLWTVEETGGAVDSGGSVRCGEKRELHVIVLDANGNRLNGVAVQAIYGAQEVFVTGNQGKGEGQVEFVLGEGQGVKVIRDADGREVTSDVVEGMITHSPYIAHEDLIAAGYCRDKESCDKFNYSAGCWGHHSWTVTFKRRY